MLPTSIKIENFYSHSDSYIDFDKFNSALLIGTIEGDDGKSNGAGKSAIFEAISWCLFNKSRAPKANDNIKWGEKSCKVTLVFQKNNETYKIERERFRENNVVSTYLFKLNELDEWENLTKETNTATNGLIQFIVGHTYKTFVNTVYFKQKDTFEFVESTPDKQKQILKDAINIGEWDLYNEKAKKLLRERKTRRDILVDEIDDPSALSSEKVLVEKEISTLNSRKKDMSAKLKIFEKSYDTVFQELLLKRSQTDSGLYEKTKNKISFLETRIDDLNIQLSSNQDSLSKKQKYLSDLEFKSSELSDQIGLFTEEENLEKRISLLSESLLELKTEFNLNKNEISRIRNFDINEGTCDSCLQKIPHSHASEIKKKHEELLADLMGQSKIIIERANVIKKEKSELELNKKEKDRVEGLVEKKDFYLNQISSLKEECSTSLSIINDISDKIKQSKNEYNEVLRVFENIKDSNFEDLENKVSFYQKEKNRINSEVAVIEKEIGRTEERLKNVEEKILGYKEKKINLQKLENEIDSLKTLTSCFGKSGIQLSLMEDSIRRLEDLTNFNMNKFKIGCKVNIKTSKINTDGNEAGSFELEFRKDGANCRYQSLSGGEQFRVALAVRTALSKLGTESYKNSNLEEKGFLLLDEVNSPLDRDGVENLFDIIKEFEKDNKLLIITHDDSLKEKFSDIIEVKKVNNDSLATYYKN